MDDDVRGRGLVRTSERTRAQIRAGLEGRLRGLAVVLSLAIGALVGVMLAHYRTAAIGAKSLGSGFRRKELRRLRNDEQKAEPSSLRVRCGAIARASVRR
jgi:hypothetical protein